MNILIAALLLYVVASCVANALTFLLAAAVAESLPADGHVLRTRLWFAALVVPHALATASVVHAVRLHALDPEPWSARAPNIKHLSFLWIADAADAAYRVKVMALVAAGVALVGLLRPLFSATLAWRRSRLLERVSTLVPELGVWVTPLDRPWSTCVGFFRTRIYVTSGLAKLLDADELASVIAHEEAHAQGRHNLQRLVAQGALGPTVIMPTAHLSLRRFEAALERCADDDATRAGVDPQTLASALVKAARRLRELAADSKDEPLRRRLANRYREEFVAERARLLIASREESHDHAPVSRRLRLLFPAALVVALVGLAAPLASPTVRSFFESVLMALEHK